MCVLDPTVSPIGLKGSPRESVLENSPHEGECLKTRQKHVQENAVETQATPEETLLRENRPQRSRTSVRSNSRRSLAAKRRAIKRRAETLSRKHAAEDW